MPLPRLELGRDSLSLGPFEDGCAGHKDWGGTICYNNLRVSRTLAEQEILVGIQRDLFTQEGLDLFVKETTKLLKEHRCQRQPEWDLARLRLNEVEGEIANITKAIKAGIFTPTTKAELENAEAERTRLQQIVTASDEKVDTVVTLLPRVKDRYRDVIEGIRAFSPQASSRLVSNCGRWSGRFGLTLVKEGHLVAILTGLYDGLVKLLNGGKLNRGGCGGRI